jgi:hypothetical protein
MVQATRKLNSVLGENEELSTNLNESSRLPARRSLEYPIYQGYQLLHVGFVVAPLVAGLDKFSNILVDWTQYLAPVFPSILGITPQTFMRIVGVVEIVAAIGVAVKPKVFGWVVSAWLVGIIINLLIKGQYYDVALRDLGLAIGAAALARIATRFDRRRMG